MSIADFDLDQVQPLGDLTLPWALVPGGSWLDYSAWVEIELDPGFVVHKPLPQGTANADTLATQLFEDYAFLKDPDAVPGAGGFKPDAPTTSGSGVNLDSEAQGTDYIQRMATSTYRFVLLGTGLRAGYQVPIPGLKSVAGVPATPDNPQRAFNRIVGNAVGGIPIFYAEWELHYMIALPMKTGVAPVPPNLALRIRADANLPAAVLVPFMQTDQDAVGTLAPPVK